MRGIIACAAMAVSVWSGAAGAADSVKIGFMTTLSGPGGGLGAEMRDGMMLALKHANGKFGGLPTEIIVQDDQQKPDIGAQIVDRFINRDKVQMITGTIFSNVLLPVVPTILESGTFVISPNTGPERFAGAGCHPLFFATAFQNEDHSLVLGKLVSERGIGEVALIAPDYPGGRETLNGFKVGFKGKVVEEIYVKMGQPDYAAEIAQLRAASPKAIFYFLPGGMGINFVRQFTASGLNRTVPLYTHGGTADEDVIKAVGEPMVGIYNSSQWTFELDNAANKKFMAEFQKEFSRRPSMFAAIGYDTGMLLDAAIRQSGGKIEDKAAFGKALKNVKFDSVRGNFRFNNNQFPIQDYYLRQVVKNDAGVVLNKQVSLIVKDYNDRFHDQCKMN